MGLFGINESEYFDFNGKRYWADKAGNYETMIFECDENGECNYNEVYCDRSGKSLKKCIKEFKKEQSEYSNNDEEISDNDEETSDNDEEISEKDEDERFLDFIASKMAESYLNNYKEKLYQLMNDSNNEEKIDKEYFSIFGDVLEFFLKKIRENPNNENVQNVIDSLYSILVLYKDTFNESDDELRILMKKKYIKKIKKIIL